MPVKYEAWLAGYLLQGRQRRVVVGVLGNFGHVLSVADRVLFINDEDGPRLETQLLDMRAVSVGGL